MKEHISIYSDESGLFVNRYQTIAAISGRDEHLFELRHLLSQALVTEDVKEIKFEHLRTHSSKIITGLSFLEYAVDFASRRHIRIEILSWDMQDKRHNVPERDNIANLTRMYYKVLVWIAKRWNEYEWSFHPDENPQVNWNEIIQILNRTPMKKGETSYPLLIDEEELENRLRFTTVQPRNSVDEPLIQLADIFAGLARFMREEGKECIGWLNLYGNKHQPLLTKLILDPCSVDDAIPTKQNRYQIAGTFNDLCKRNKLGVSLKNKKCFWTPNPMNPINFWNYAPQHEYDKAPKKR